MKKFGHELEFISWINRDGSGTVVVPKDQEEWAQNELFKLNRLSISEDTWIASGFNSYVVKIKSKNDDKNN